MLFMSLQVVLLERKEHWHQTTISRPLVVCGMRFVFIGICFPLSLYFQQSVFNMLV